MATETDAPTNTAGEDKPGKRGPKGTVRVRILPKGDGKLSTGEYDKQTNSFPSHKRGDTVFLHPSIAEAQEENGFVEIEP